MTDNSHKFLPIKEANQRLQTQENDESYRNQIQEKNVDNTQYGGEVQINFTPSKSKVIEDVVKWRVPRNFKRNPIYEENSR